MVDQKEIIVLDTSDDAAKKITVTGWVSRHGRFYGEDERLARYDGCTHKTCECGRIMERSRLKCDQCRGSGRLEAFYKMPTKKWDYETPLCMFDSDEFFWNEEQVQEYAYEHEVSISDMKLVLCEPVFAHEVDPSEYYSDKLPDDADGEVPAEIEDAFKELNERIREYKEPLSWVSGKYRVEL